MGGWAGTFRYVAWMWARGFFCSCFFVPGTSQSSFPSSHVHHRFNLSDTMAMMMQEEVPGAAQDMTDAVPQGDDMLTDDAELTYRDIDEVCSTVVQFNPCSILP